MLEAVGPDAFALGLLMGTEGEESLAFSFHHRLLQEFTAGRVVARMDEVSGWGQDIEVGQGGGCEGVEGGRACLAIF